MEPNQIVNFKLTHFLKDLARGTTEKNPKIEIINFSLFNWSASLVMRSISNLF